MRARTAGRRRRDFCERAEWSVCRRGDLFLPRARAKVVPGAMSHRARRPLEVPPSGRDCFAFSTRRGEITPRASGDEGGTGAGAGDSLCYTPVALVVVERGDSLCFPGSARGGRA